MSVMGSTSDPEEYEDIIGVIKISLDGIDSSSVVIENLEIGNWKGSIEQENIISGSCHDDDIKFKLELREESIGKKCYMVIEGAVLNEILEPDFNVYFRKIEAHK